MKEYASSVLKVPFLSRNEYFKKTDRIYYGQCCYQMWKEPQFNWDGTMLGCCNNYWKPYKKNIFIDGYQKCISDELFSYSKEMLLGRKEPSSKSPCFMCNVYSIMKNHALWLSEEEAENGLPINWAK